MFHAGLLMTHAGDPAAVSVLLDQAPQLGRASDLEGRRLEVVEPLARLLPHGGLRPGTATQVTGVAATTLGLALVAAASQASWTAIVGLPHLGTLAATELGVDLDHVVVIADPGKRWTDVIGAVVDAFDIVLARPQLGQREARRVAGRVRERDAVFVTVGGWIESDVRIATSSPRWHGIEHGHGHLAARTVEVAVTGRRAASRATSATLWLPDHDGGISTVERSNIVALDRRAGTA
jgi:hypothetical protein